MKNSKRRDFDWSKDKKGDPALLKKYPKPWDQATHDKYMKEKGITPKGHDKWHDKHEESK